MFQRSPDGKGMVGVGSDNARGRFDDFSIQVLPPTITVDVTFPLPAWDGTTPLPLACGSGEDFPAGNDPIASKAALVRRWCDPEIREPFIAALVREQAKPR